MKTFNKESIIFYTSISLLLSVVIWGTVLLESKIFQINGENFRESLQTVTETAVQSIQDNYSKYESDINYWANSKQIQKLAKELNDPNITKDHREEVGVTIYTLLSPFLVPLGLEGYFILSKEGINLASSRESNTSVKGIIFDDKKSWKEAFAGKTTITKIMKSDVPLAKENGELIPQRSTMFIISPIIDINGKFISILAFRINPKKMFWKVLSRGRIGSSGESYAINQDGQLISPSRFKVFLKKQNIIQDNKSEMLNFSVKQSDGRLTKMAQSLTQKKTDHNIEGYQDYRGIPVIGYWHWIENLKFGITSEIDYDEAYNLFNSIRKLIWFFAITLCLVIIFSSHSLKSKIMLLGKKAQEGEDRLQSIFDNTKGIIYRCNPNKNWTMTYMNNAIEELSGYPATDFINDSIRPYASIIKPKHQKIVEQIVFNALKIKEPFEIEYDILTTEGKTKTVFERGQGFFDEFGQCSHLDGFIIDISDKKELERDLKWQLQISQCTSKTLEISQSKAPIENKLEKVLRVVLENNKTLSINGRGGIFLAKNNALTVSIEEGVDHSLIKSLSKLNFHKYIVDHSTINGEFENHPSNREEIKEGYEQLDSSSFTAIPFFDKDKYPLGLLVLHHSNGIKLSKKEILFLKSIARIISNFLEKSLLESNLEQERKIAIQSSKLATLGEMAAGVAHEINNPLAIISGNAQILKMNLNNPEKVVLTSDKIENSVQRIVKIVRGLKKFSRNSAELEIGEHSMAQILSETQTLISAKSGRDNVPVTFEYADELKIECDDIQIQQILINLVNNGIDAVSNSQDPWVKVTTNGNASFVEFIVQDSGNGIDEFNVEKLFNPFFTTKVIGEGTGLGLSISKGISQDHGGDLQYSLIGGHTAFILTIPHNKKANVA